MQCKAVHMLSSGQCAYSRTVSRGLYCLHRGHPAVWLEKIGLVKVGLLSRVLLAPLRKQHAQHMLPSAPVCQACMQNACRCYTAASCQSGRTLPV